MANKPTLQPGQLDKHVTLKSPPSATSGQDSYGAPAASPATIVTDWAKIEPVAGGEAFEGLQVIARATHKVTMRYRSTVTPGCLVVYGSRTLYVGLIQNPGENDWAMILVCGEKVAP